MKIRSTAILVSLAIFAVRPLTATDFIVVTATGIVEPEGLETGQELEKATRLRLEPWGRAVVRETTGCELTHVIAGASDHELTLAEDCSDVGKPMVIAALIQQGAAFAARLKTTGTGPADGLVQMLVEEPCVFLARVSEEPVNKRHCPSGYALRGLRCNGQFCDNKDLLCCPYLDGQPDPSAKTTPTRLISEELPNVVQTKRFLNGLECTGPYCDNLLMYQLKSSRLVKTRDCEWSPWTLDQPDAWLDCGPGRLISGIRCQGDYCGNVGVHCCQTQVQ